MKRSDQFHKAMAAYNDDRPAEALKLMEDCARENDHIACYQVALWYRHGEGTAVNLERSEWWLARVEELAEQGNVEAQWDVGMCYRFGDQMPLDIERANYWLERAADGGSGDAQHHLALYYERGQYGYSIDPAAAQKWYTRAFEQAHPETLYLYAIRMFCDGKPTDEALRLLRSAADKGFKQAEHLLRSIMN